MMIRKFQPADLNAVLELFHDAVHSLGAKYYNQQQVEAWAPKILDQEKWLESLMANIAYVAETQGKIVGFGDMTLSGHIERLYVHKNVQGKGVALALFKKLEEEARKRGLKELTAEASIMAQPLAERQGFIVVQKKRKVRRGVEFTVYIMHKKL